MTFNGTLCVSLDIARHAVSDDCIHS